MFYGEMEKPVLDSRKEMRVLEGKEVVESGVAVMCRKEFEEKIAEGRLLIIYDGFVLDLTKWALYHPGGLLPLKHMVGRDATSQIRVFHPNYVLEHKVSRFVIGKIVESRNVSLSHVDSDLDLGLSDEENSDLTIISDSAASTMRDEDLTATVYDKPELVRERFMAIQEEIENDGLEKTNPHFYFKIYFRLVFQFLIVWALILVDAENTWILASFLMALFWHQAAFIGHDTGHSAITHDLSTDHMIGVTVGNFFGGISMGWWKDSHYVHHVITNDPEHDPDIQHLPFFAVSEKFFKSLYSTYHERYMVFDFLAKLFVSLQHYLYYPVLCFGRFNLYVQSFSYLYFRKIVRRRKLEAFGLVCFWIWYGILMSFLPSVFSRVVFTLIANAMTVFLHIQITLSHFAMSTEKIGETEEFISHQLRTTMDIDSPRYMDWFHGGLQFQAIHHLFPRVPRHNLRLLRTKVIKACHEIGIPYKCVGFFEANLLVLSSLKKVATSASSLLL